MNVPDDAVEAAARAWVSRHAQPGSWTLEQNLRAAIEAAAPHMRRALRADLVKLAQEFDAAEGGTLAYTVIVDRFGMRKNAHDQLMRIVENHLHAEETR